MEIEIYFLLHALYPLNGRRPLTEKKGINFLQVACVGAGIFIGLILMRVVFGLGGAIGGAIGGGFGAVVGLGLYALINRRK